jgi:hypothetical protein
MNNLSRVIVSVNKLKALRAIWCEGLFIGLLLLTSQGYSQDRPTIKMGAITAKDFVVSPSANLIDSNTNAVVLSDLGTTSFVGNKEQWFSYVYKRQTRIKLINKKSFDQFSTIRIMVYGKDDDFEKVDNITGSTYNLENGKIVETKLDKKDVFDDRLDKNHLEKKFTMPGVKEGSIIEYSYTITSPYLFNMPEWQFQYVGYPCLWSECQVEIPQLLFYVLVKQGIHNYYINKGVEGHQTYNLREKSDATTAHDLTGMERSLLVGATTIKHDWAMKDIPAFRTESYLTTPRNYVDKIEFQLSKTYNGEEYRDVANTWKKANEELLGAEYFGGALSENNAVQALTDKVVSNVADGLQQAKSIYYFVSTNFSCNNYNYPFVGTNLANVIKKKGGSVGDLNLLLVAMLRRQHISADPVLLSTRAYGFNLPNYPMEDRLNYVIVRTKIGERIYYLDAAHPQLGFGQLDGECYNGHARIISEKDSGSVYFYPDSLREKKTTIVFLTPGEKGEIEGHYQSVPGMLESYNIRKSIGKNGLKQYFKNVQTSYGDDLLVGEAGVDSLDKPELPVNVHFDFKLNEAPDASIIYINPLFTKWQFGNPFKDAKREYPVEMENVFDDNYIYNMDIPEGYVVDELPKSTKVTFNENDGVFEYMIAVSDNLVQLKAHFKLNKAFYSPEEYGSLREFFDIVVKKESEHIVLKKKQ